MRPELEEIRIIEAYLEGKLSAEDRAKIEAKMEEDPDFRQKVEMQRDLTEGIWNAALIAEINKAHTEFIRTEQGGGGSSGWLGLHSTHSPSNSHWDSLHQGGALPGSP